MTRVRQPDRTEPADMAATAVAERDQDRRSDVGTMMLSLAFDLSDAAGRIERGDFEGPLRGYLDQLWQDVVGPAWGKMDKEAAQ